MQPKLTAKARCSDREVGKKGRGKKEPTLRKVASVAPSNKASGMSENNTLNRIRKLQYQAQDFFYKLDKSPFMGSNITYSAGERAINDLLQSIWRAIVCKGLGLPEAVRCHKTQLQTTQ